MVAGKFYYRYEDVSCSTRNMWSKMIYVLIDFFQNKKLDFRQMKAEL